MAENQGNTYRIVVAHGDADHENAAEFTWRNIFAYNSMYHDTDYDPLSDARSRLAEADYEFPAADGYSARVQVLRDGDWVDVED